MNKPFSMHIDVDQFLPASREDKEYMVQMRPSSTFFKDGVKRLLKNPIATISLILIVLITLTSIFLPMFWPYTYEQQLIYQEWGERPDPSYIEIPPYNIFTGKGGYCQDELDRMANGEKIMPHLFGTDSIGRDYFIRVVYGTRISLAVGFFASLIVLVIGLTIGSIAGYIGGKVDLIIMRIVDIIYSLPDTLMVILLAASMKDVFGPILKGTVLEKLGSNIMSMFIVFALLYWVSMARLIRGQILSLREQEYVLASKAAGAKSGWVIKKHLIPNCISVVIISTALQIPNAIFTESYLSFLGLGVNPPMPSLGSLAQEALDYKTKLYFLIIPAVVIGLVVLSLNLLGDGLRDAFDPKLKK